MKAESRRLIPLKPIENLELLFAFPVYALFLRSLGMAGEHMNNDMMFSETFNWKYATSVPLYLSYKMRHLFNVFNQSTTGHLFHFDLFECNDGGCRNID